LLLLSLNVVSSLLLYYSPEFLYKYHTQNPSLLIKTTDFGLPHRAINGTSSTAAHVRIAEGTEKPVENKNYTCATDCVAMRTQAQLSAVVGKLHRCYSPLRVQAVRVLFTELTRILPLSSPASGLGVRVLSTLTFVSFLLTEDVNSLAFAGLPFVTSIGKWYRGFRGKTLEERALPLANFLRRNLQVGIGPLFFPGFM